MIRKFTSLTAAAALALATFAPGLAQAQDRHGYYDRQYYGDHDGYRDYDRHRYDHRRRYRDRDDDHGDAVAAGVIGLVLGLALGAAASQPRGPEARCYDNYQRCEPPQRPYNQGYYDRGGAEYDAAPPCTRRERQWDRYANRYVTIDVPC